MNDINCNSTIDALVTYVFAAKFAIWYYVAITPVNAHEYSPLVIQAMSSHSCSLISAQPISNLIFTFLILVEIFTSLVGIM